MHKKTNSITTLIKLGASLNYEKSWHPSQQNLNCWTVFTLIITYISFHNEIFALLIQCPVFSQFKWKCRRVCFVLGSAKNFAIVKMKKNLQIWVPTVQVLNGLKVFVKFGKDSKGSIVNLQEDLLLLILVRIQNGYMPIVCLMYRKSTQCAMIMFGFLRDHL